MAKWINANETLPEQQLRQFSDDSDWYMVSDRVLICVPEESSDQGDRIFIGYYETFNNKVHWYIENASEIKVSHWMPLPELP